MLLLARGGDRLQEPRPRTLAPPLSPSSLMWVTRAASAVRSPRWVIVSAGSTSLSTTCRCTGRAGVELLSDLDVQQQIATNLAGPVYTCRAAIPLLRAAGGGDIVNTSSESTLHPFPMLSMYVATKAGLEAFALVLEQEVREDDIRVTTVIQGGSNGPGGGVDGLGVGPRARRGGDRPLDRVGTDRPGLRPPRGAGGLRHRRRARLHRHAATQPEDGHGLLPQLLKR